MDKLLALSKMSRSTYYYQVKRLSRPDKYNNIKNLIKTIFEYHKGRYGYRRIQVELQQYGCNINHKTIQRLMQELSLYGKCKKNKYKSYKGNVGKIAPNILNRQFKSDKPYEKLVTDVTEFKGYVTLFL